MVKIILDNPNFQSLEVGENGNLHWKQVLQAAASGGAWESLNATYASRDPSWRCVRKAK